MTLLEKYLNCPFKIIRTSIKHNFPTDLVIEMVYQGRAEAKSTHLRPDGQPRRLNIHATPTQ